MCTTFVEYDWSLLGGGEGGSVFPACQVEFETSSDEDHQSNLEQSWTMRVQTYKRILFTAQGKLGALWIGRMLVSKKG